MWRPVLEPAFTGIVVLLVGGVLPTSATNSRSDHRSGCVSGSKPCLVMYTL
jgi:hypothetical protein